MTKATGKPRGETWRGRRDAGESGRGGEVNGLTQGSGRRGPEGDPLPVLSVWCLKVRSTGSETGLLTRKICCFDFTLSCLFLLPFCSRSSLLTFSTPSPPPVYLPHSLSTLPSSIGSSGTSQLSLCRLSRWPSLRSALECCFYIAASGGMWSLFWTARQTDGGFHAAFMRLSEIFPLKKKTFPCVPSPSTVSLSPCLAFLFLSVFVSSAFFFFFFGSPQAWARARCCWKCSGK